MRQHRFFIQTGLREKVLRVADRELVDQWRKVLRFKDGKEILVFDGSGAEARTKILRFHENAAELAVLEVFENKNEPSRRVVLYCSVLKRENFELVAQKATEAGVFEVSPIIAERTEKLNLRIDRLERIVKEAAEQSGRAIVPKINEPAKFEEAAKRAARNGANFIFDKTGKDFTDTLCSPGDARIGVWIGPEGGWAEEELALAEGAGFKKAGLGPLTLRAETAAIVASYLVARHIVCRLRDCQRGD